MRRHLITTLFCSLIFSCSSFAMPVNSYFQQAISVDNESSQTVLITDSTVPTSDHLLLIPSKYVGHYTFASDQFTTLPEQLFSHTVDVISAEDNKPICTVTSHLTIGLTSLNADKPTTNNPSKCETSVRMSFTSEGQIYGFAITVH